MPLGALIVSLLFLSDIANPVTALDDVGGTLAGATLTFWKSGTTAPLATYSDESLTEAATDALGKVTADADGEFEAMFMQDAEYRVVLKRADGRLVYDIDPYICDCTDPPRAFRDPVYRPLDGNGVPYPGATLTFSLASGATPTNAYSDSALTIPHKNPLKANAGGAFPPIYLNDDISYRVRLHDADGNEISDSDPYVCACGFNGTIIGAGTYGGTSPLVRSPGDGTWALASGGQSSTFNCVRWAFELGCGIATNTAGSVYRTTDLQTYTLVASISPSAQRAAWSPSLRLFVIVTTGNVIYSSPDGIAWTTVSGVPTLDYRDVIWSERVGLFIATSGSSNQFATSPDGVAWTVRTVPNTNRAWRRICESDELGLFVVVDNGATGNRVAFSSNGIDWDSALTGTSAQAWQAVAWSPSLELFVAVANNTTGDVIMTSPDGEDWTVISGPGNRQWTSIIWAPHVGKFFAGGFRSSPAGYNIMSSPDGETFEIEDCEDIQHPTLGINYRLNDLTYARHV